MSLKKSTTTPSLPAILVVERHKFQRRSLCRLMRAAGADRVAEAADMNAAQRVVTTRRWPTWILVIDPDAVGPEAMFAIKQFVDSHPVVATLLLTQHRPPAAEQLREQAGQLGLPLLAARRKPISAEEAGTLLRRWTEQPASAHVPKAHVLSVEELGECLRSGRVHARFQPKIDLESGRPVGCEAVPHLIHARYGELSATRFSHAMMQLGAQRVMTASVLRDAAELIRLLREKSLSTTVSVNVAPDVLSESGDAASLDSYVRTLGVAPADLVLEIATSRHALSFPSFGDNVARLKMKGYSLSIDDIPGALELGDPVHAHFAEVKLAWISALRQPRDSAAARVAGDAVKLAHKHGIAACAIGVDSNADLDLVRRAGFDLAQGELFAPSLSADEVVHWLEREERNRSFADQSVSSHLAS